LKEKEEVGGEGERGRKGGWWKVRSKEDARRENGRKKTTRENRSQEKRADTPRDKDICRTYEASL